MTLNDANYRRRAQVLKALGHPSRLAMVEALLEGEKCVCELQELVGSDMSTVSKHLSVLRSAGIVCDRKQGLWVYYSLRLPCVARFFECVDEVLE
jgi:DNA-binding transcriptional ArsR family regulator